MVRRDAIGLLALAPFAGAGIARAAAGDQSYELERSLVTHVTARDGHSYRLLVAWPEGQPPSGGWPVLVILDGADNFAIAAETTRRLVTASQRSGVRAGLTVAIDSGPLARRVLDYTPVVVGYAIPQGAPASGLAIGGADRFLTTLEETILPHVAKRWPCDLARSTLGGHSFGGLLALNALTGRIGSFRRFAAVSPSLWYGDGFIDRRAAGQAELIGTRLLLAEGMPAGYTGGERLPAHRRLATALGERGSQARVLDLGDLDHGSTMAGAMGNIVRLAFADSAS